MSEWIKTSDCQPEQSGYYLLNVKWCNLIQVVHYSAKYGKWNVHDDADEEWVRKVGYPEREAYEWHELPKRFKALAELIGTAELERDLTDLLKIVKEAHKNG
jgi:hypothetical protein